MLPHRGQHAVELRVSAHDTSLEKKRAGGRGVRSDVVSSSVRACSPAREIYESSRPRPRGAQRGKIMTEQRVDESGPGRQGANGHAYTAGGTSTEAEGAHDFQANGREFSLKSFKCFARQHPLLVGMGAAGIGAAVVTLGAGYVLYRGAQRTLPVRAFKLARLLVTF